MQFFSGDKMRENTCSKAFQSSSEKLGNKNKVKQQLNFLLKLGLVLIKVESRGCHEKRRSTFFKTLPQPSSNYSWLPRRASLLTIQMCNYYTGQFLATCLVHWELVLPQREKSGTQGTESNVSTKFVASQSSGWISFCCQNMAFSWFSFAVSEFRSV